jgi:hypothetical protein
LFVFIVMGGLFMFAHCMPNHYSYVATACRKGRIQFFSPKSQSLTARLQNNFACYAIHKLDLCKPYAFYRELRFDKSESYALLICVK